MFDDIKEKVLQLDNEVDVTKYTQVRDTRKLLQVIKMVTQELRVKLMTAYKESKAK